MSSVFIFFRTIDIFFIIKSVSSFFFFLEHFHSNAAIFVSFDSTFDTFMNSETTFFRDDLEIVVHLWYLLNKDWEDCFCWVSYRTFKMISVNNLAKLTRQKWKFKTKKTWLVLLVPRNNNGNSDLVQVD